KPARFPSPTRVSSPVPDRADRALPTPPPPIIPSPTDTEHDPPATGPASRPRLRRHSRIRPDPLARRRRIRRRDALPVSRLAILAGRIRPTRLLGSAAPDEYARRLFADAGHPCDVAHGLPALLHRAHRDTALP